MADDQTTTTTTTTVNDNDLKLSPDTNVNETESEVDETDFFDAIEAPSSDLAENLNEKLNLLLTNTDAAATAELKEESNEKFEDPACCVVVNASDGEDFDSFSKDTKIHKKEKFVPLHERLNQERATEAEAATTALKDDHELERDGDDEDEAIKQHAEETDPNFIDDLAKEKEEQDLTEEDLDERLKQAQEQKSKGNDLFKEEKFTEAIEFYTNALRLCPLKFVKERSIFYSNRSACYHKMKEYEKCINDCTKSIDLDEKFIKPFLRRAECYQSIEKLDEALEDYRKLSNELEPNNRLHKQNCFQLEQKIKDRNEKLKEEMMGKLKDLGNMVLKPFGLSTSNFQFVQDPTTGSYSVNFKK